MALEYTAEIGAAGLPVTPGNTVQFGPDRRWDLSLNPDHRKLPELLTTTTDILG